MSVPGSASPLFFQQAAAAEAGYKVERSLRFNSDDNANLTRTPSSAGNTNTYTISFWMKLGELGTDRAILSARRNSFNRNLLYLGAGDKLQYQVRRSGSTVVDIETRGVLRDPSAWYHVVVSSDSGTQKLYINNVEEDSDNDTGSSELNDTEDHAIGKEAITNSFPFDGYLAEFHLVDGTTLAPTDFAEYDSDNNWNPKAYTGSYGTNGFYLKFNDNTSTTTISEDSSGNGNDWTATNISVASGAGNDSLIDTPTNYTAAGNNGGNYATLNPIDSAPTGLSNGNLDSSSADAYPTIIPGSGQWYYEVDGTGYTWDGTRANYTPRAGSHNFGQRPFSGTPTAGHVSVCTQNLPDPTIADGSTAMNATLYTGNGSTQSITGLNFQPDLVWIKNRAVTDEHKLTDSVRGATKEIASNSNDPQFTNSDGLTAFNSDGFTLGDDLEYNTNSEAYVAWSWDASATTGFSIITYTGTGSVRTVSHGLNAKPYLIVIKKTSGSTRNWSVYTEPTGATKFLRLNTDLTATTNAAYWNNTEPTNTVFTVNTNSTVNTNNESYVAYCWAPVEGFSSISSYTGGGSSLGAFVYTGFRPRWILIKRTNSAADWYIFDSRREGYNADNDRLIANETSSESTTDYIDIVSNGFKLRSSSSDVNGSGSTYFYAAFAEHPFKTARAR